ncbi:MAG: toll/interleukin-1 receptor domain-containing protein [Desulfobulbus sp.]|jgi:hypothetical protein|nr:toll/interleukin-1 receptor domain-containing protein [Desulfobulbus sp.]
MPNLDVFISHSSLDELVAARLIALLRSALNLPADRIRCTSVDGYRLPAGISTNDRVRKEVHDSKAFIALITPNSLGSAYVLFELGARWGAEKPLIPLLASGAETRHLKEPLSGFNALSCSNAAQLHQFVHDLGGILGAASDSAAAYQEHIQALVDESSNTTAVSSSATEDSDDLATQKRTLPNLDPSSSVLLAIWSLDIEQYSENGYNVEAVANKAALAIPTCKHHLETLVKQKQITRVQVIGTNGGVRYRLTTGGSSHLMNNGIVT